MPSVVTAVVSAAGALISSAASVVGSSTLASIATSVVLGAASRALSKRPNSSNLGQSGHDRSLMVRQALPTRKVIYGEVKVSGPIAFIHSTERNRYLHLVILLASHEIEGIESIYFDDTEVEFNSRGEAQGKFKRKAWVYPHYGYDNQRADSRLKEAAPDKWTDKHRLRGIAYLYVKMKWDNDVYEGSIPNISAVIKGKKLRDPRTDTVHYSSNPALCIYDYLTNSRYGFGIPVDQIDMEALIAAANICDEEVPLQNGSAEPRYTCNGVLDTSVTPKENLQSLLTSLTGKLVYTGGVWRLLAGAYYPPHITLDEDDLRGPIHVQSRLSRRDAFNRVKGIYVCPENQWQPADFPPVTDEYYLKQDKGVPSWKDITLEYTTSAATAQRIARIELEKARQQISLILPCKLTAFQLCAGDVVNISNQRMGWSKKPFEVTEWQFLIEEDEEGNPLPGINLRLRETSPLVFTWDPNQTVTVDHAPDTTLPDPFVAEQIGEISIESGQNFIRIDAEGNAINRMMASWPDVKDEFVRQGGYIEVQYKKASDKEWSETRRLPGTARQVIYERLEGRRSYYVRARAVNHLGKAGEWTQSNSHRVVGKEEPPDDVPFLLISQSGDSVVLIWGEVTNPDLKNYDIRYARKRGRGWESSRIVARVPKGVLQWTHKIEPGTWRFDIRARDSSGICSRSKTYAEITVNNPNQIDRIIDLEGFPGELTGCIHHLGDIIPKSQGVCSDYGWEAFDEQIPKPALDATYTSPTVSLGKRVSARLWLEKDRDNCNVTLIADEVEYPEWTSGPVCCEAVAIRLKVSSPISYCRVVIDLPERTEKGTAQVTADGNRLEFNQPFNRIPQVNVTAVENTPHVCTLQSVDRQGFVVQVFRLNGEPIPAHIQYQAIGS